MAMVCEGLGRFRPIRECSNGHVAPFYSIYGKLCSDCVKERNRKAWAGPLGPKRNARRRHTYLMGLSSRERRDERNKLFREQNRGYHLKYTYGITVEKYNEMLAQQNGCCAICSKEHPKLVVDHSHATGNVRGLLCRSCNTGIGCLKESREIFSSALAYLEERV